MMKDRIGDRIKMLIEKENVSLQFFANEIGITPGGLNHILTGRNKPRYDMLLKIVSKYGDLSLDWLMLGNLPMYKKEKAILSSSAELNLFDTDSKDLLEIKEIHKLKNIKKSEKSLIESSVKEFSMSEAIEEIRVYFNNKTYLVLKPEK